MGMNWHRNVIASSHGLSAGSACTGPAMASAAATAASAANAVLVGIPMDN